MLAINEIELGMKFQSTSPVFRGDNTEFPTGAAFKVVQVSARWIKLKCEVEGRHIYAPPVPRPEGKPEDYFFYVDVNIDTLNQQFVKAE